MARALLVLLLVAACGDTDCCRVRPLLPADVEGYSPIKVPEPVAHWQGEMVGEVTQISAILQARLTVGGKVRSRDVMGCPGVATFVLSRHEDFSGAVRTRWMAATAENDYIVKTAITGLGPGTRYYYRLLSGPDVEQAEAGPTGTFRTLDAPEIEASGREVRFVTVTGMNQFAFRALALKNLAFKDRALGFPALETILAHEPDFFVNTGDGVYYDTPFVGRAETREAMRAKWHRQFATPRFEALFLQVPTYWEKDDHDFRYDDADAYGDHTPSAELGAATFLEQVPVVDPQDPAARTYRTYRIHDLLQIWLLEGRDYRDPNTAGPGPDKTLWGAEQKAWLKETLLASDATFKIVISPTPLVGPDDAFKGGQGGILAPYFGGRALGQGDDRNKRDNHTNVYGYRDESEAFFAWLSANGFEDRNLYFLCGDKHWQYHAVHSSGFEEFSVGALVDGNARLGPLPGDPESTDPQGLITHLYAQGRASGGFLEITVHPPSGEERAVAEFVFYDEGGTLLYRVEKPAH